MINKIEIIRNGKNLCDNCDNMTESPEVSSQVVWGKPQPPIIGPKTFYCEHKMSRIQYSKRRTKCCEGYTPFDGSGTEE